MADIDFAHLSLKDALDMALLVEQRAEQAYRQLIKRMENNRTSKAARFFHFMAVCEAKHGYTLSERRKRLFGDAPCEVDSSLLNGIESPKTDQDQDVMPVLQALTIALNAEKTAYDFFDQAIPEIADEGVRQLFAELRQEEIEHQDLVKRVIDAVENEVDFDPDELVGESAAQAWRW